MESAQGRASAHYTTIAAPPSTVSLTPRRQRDRMCEGSSMHRVQDVSLGDQPHLCESRSGVGVWEISAGDNERDTQPAGEQKPT